MATLTGGMTASKAVDLAIRNAAAFKLQVVPEWNALLLAGNVTAEDVAKNLYAAVARSHDQLVSLVAVPGFNEVARVERNDPTLDAVAETTTIIDLQQAVLDLIIAGAASITPTMANPADIWAAQNEREKSILANRFSSAATAGIRTALTAAAAAITAPP